MAPSAQGCQERPAVATFGRPWRVYHVAGFTILDYRENLLAHMAASAGKAGP